MAIAQAPRKTTTEGQITDEEIDLNDILPGFHSRVAELFGMRR